MLMTWWYKEPGHQWINSHHALLNPQLSSILISFKPHLHKMLIALTSNLVHEFIDWLFFVTLCCLLRLVGGTVSGHFSAICFNVNFIRKCSFLLCPPHTHTHIRFRPFDLANNRDHSVHESWCYIVMLSLIGWVHTQNDPWVLVPCAGGK